MGDPIEGDPFAVQVPPPQAIPTDVKRVLVGQTDPNLIEGDPFAPTAAGLAKSAGVGVAEGLIGIPGMAGDVQQLAGKAADYIAEKRPPEPGLETQYIDQLRKIGFPTSEHLKSLVEQVTGKFYEPQNQAEKDVQTGGQFAGSAILNPGGVVRKAIQAVVPAGTTIVAGRYSDQNPYVKALAGLVGGVGAGTLTAPGSADKLLRSKFPGLTEQHITDAGQLIDRAKQAGVDLTWPEAISQVAGRPIGTDLQRILESHPLTRDTMNDFMAPRAQQVADAAKAELPYIGGTTQRPSGLGPKAGETVDQFFNETRDIINNAAAPFYKAAETYRFTPAEYAAVRTIPNYDKMVKAVRASDDAWRVKHLPDDSVGVLNEVKKQFNARADAASHPMNPEANKQLASTYGGGASAAKQIGEVASPEYKAALEIERAGRNIMDEIQHGPIGQIARSDRSTRNVVNILFKQADAGSEHEIGQAVHMLASRRPAVAEALVRLHIENTLNRSLKSLQGGDSQFAGAKFRAKLLGDPQDRANVKAAVEALPNGKDTWNGIEQMMEIMQATGQRQAKGSLTAFNALDAANMTSQGIVNAITSTAKGINNPLAVAKQLHEKYQAWSAGENLKDFARIITDPRSADVFRRLRNIDPNSSAAVDIVGRLIAHVTASTTQMRVNPGKN